MNPRHWKITLLKNGIETTLFTTTTDDMVNRDLGGEIHNSLICTARQYHRLAQDLEQNHRDLAIGAFMAHAATPQFDREGTHIQRTDFVPETEPTTYVGGCRNNAVVPIWEVTGHATIPDSFEERERI